MMMNQGPGVCPHDDRDQLAADFLAGRLGEDRAEAFEAHCYACDACFASLELAASLHAALRPPGAEAPRRTRTAATWAWAAAAVLAVAVGYGLYRPADRLADASSLRGREDAFAVTARGDAAGLTLRWSAVEGAERYEARVFSPEGEPLWDRRTSETQLSVPAAELPPGADVRRLFARVDALDALGGPVARSHLVPVEGARAP